jgi:hypothetical protein
MECFPDKGIIKTFVRLKYTDFVFDYRFIINDDQDFDPSVKIDTTEILVSKYLERRIQVLAGGNKLKGQLTNIESVNGELRLDFIFVYNKKAKLFKVKNAMLTEYREIQSNFLIFKYKDFEEGVELTSEKMEQTFKVK